MKNFRALSFLGTMLIVVLLANICSATADRAKIGLAAPQAPESDTNWSALGSGLNGSVQALAMDSQGNLYAGGEFTLAGSTTVNYVAKWDGTTWSALGSGVSGNLATEEPPHVSALWVDGSDLYVGGRFTHAGGIPARCIAKWNGKNWSALGSGLGQSVYALWKDGSNLYVGGAFAMAGGKDAKYIARWDGSNWYPLGSGMDWSVFDLVVDKNGHLIASGLFNKAGGKTANSIARWDGSEWWAFSSAPDGWVYALAKDSGGTLYAEDEKWTGSAWVKLGSGMNGDIEDLAVDGSDNLYAGGLFSTAGSMNAKRIAKWDGSQWHALGSGITSVQPLGEQQVYALAVSDALGYLYVGGEFDLAGGKPALNIARWSLASADLAITKTDGRASLELNAANTYTITVTNLGPEAVSAATVSDVFPAAFTNVTWVCSASAGASCASINGSGNIQLNVDLAANSSVTLVATGNVSGSVACMLTNTASVKMPGGENDSNPANNWASDTSAVPNGTCVFLPLLVK